MDYHCLNPISVSQWLIAASRFSTYFLVDNCSEFILPTSILSSFIFLISLLMAGSKMFLSWVVSSRMFVCKACEEFFRVLIWFLTISLRSNKLALFLLIASSKNLLICYVFHSLPPICRCVQLGSCPQASASWLRTRWSPLFLASSKYYYGNCSS